jgi:hypothetical protein
MVGHRQELIHKHSTPSEVAQAEMLLRKFKLQSTPTWLPRCARGTELNYFWRTLNRSPQSDQGIRKFIYRRDQRSTCLIEAVSRGLTLSRLAEFRDSRKVRVVSLQHRVETKARFELFETNPNILDAFF